MSDLIWLTIAGIICIIISYGLGLQVGYRKGLKEDYYRKCIEHAESILTWKRGKEDEQNTGL